MEIKEFKNRLHKLTAQEIQELQYDEAMRIMEQNCNLLTDMEKVLFDEIGEYGRHRIIVEQIKSIKSTVIEQNRALKVVVQSG